MGGVWVDVGWWLVGGEGWWGVVWGGVGVLFVVCVVGVLCLGVEWCLGCGGGGHSPNSSNQSPRTQPVCKAAKYGDIA